MLTIIIVIFICGIAIAAYLIYNSNKKESIEYNVEIHTGDSRLSKKDREEIENMENKYPKWYSENTTKGICYKSERIEPLENNAEDVYFKTDRYTDLFGRGKNCSYFPGYGEIYNRTFEIWYQDFGSKEKNGIIEYKDIGTDYLPPFFTEEFTGDWLINNELSNKQEFIKFYNIRIIKSRKTWYAGLKNIEFIGIITKAENK